MFQRLLGVAVRQSPQGLDGTVPHLRLKHRGCVAILDAETLVLVFQVVFDIEFGVFLQKLGPMEVASSLAPINGNLWISRPIDNPHNFPISLRIVGHEAFEVGLGDPMASHDVVEVMPKKYSSIFVLRLEVAASNGHDVDVDSVIYVACHGGPLDNAFDMVGHDSNMLKIPASLHVFIYIDPTIKADFRHLENKNFVRLVIVA